MGLLYIFKEARTMGRPKKEDARTDQFRLRTNYTEKHMLDKLAHTCRVDKSTLVRCLIIQAYWEYVAIPQEDPKILDYVKMRQDIWRKGRERFDAEYVRNLARLLRKVEELS